MLRLPRMFRSIENRNYRLYFFGQLTSLLGSWLQSVAQVWLVYRLTGSSFQLGLLVFIGQAPLLFLSPIGGLIADRYPRRWVVVATQTTSMMLAFVLAVGAAVLPDLFTNDRAVLDAIGVPWWFLVAQLPIAGVVFGLDGVLLGAGDAKFMRSATVISALAGFLPLIWLSLAFGWGLAGIWSGLSTFIVLRLVFVGWRAFSGQWAVPGTGQ